ncbi:hypothetical protein AB3S75_014409 [Citrus x aurantiifolia]
MFLCRYSGRWEQEDDLVGFVSTSLCMLVCLGNLVEFVSRNNSGFPQHNLWPEKKVFFFWSEAECLLRNIKYV